MDYILHNSPPYLILHPEVLSEKELIDLVLELYRSAQKQEGAYALQLYSCIYRICYRLWEKMQNVVNPWEPNDSKQLEAMHKMVGFIQQNYSSKIALQDIAAAGFVCRSSCCSIFKRYLNQTPVSYLTEYRINEACKLLRAGNLSIAEVAISVGFFDQFYFSRVFKRAKGMPPSKYIAAQSENADAPASEEA